MKVLAISFLFPNKRHPYYGIFVLNRLAAASKYCEIKVLAPVPWFPFRKYIPGYTDLSCIPKQTKNEGLEVYHPRFFCIPHFFKWLDGFFYLLCTIRTIKSIRKKYDFDIIDVHWVYPDIITAYTISKIFKKPMIVTVRGKEAVCFGEKSLRKIIIDRFIRKSDHVVCVSNELASIVKNIGLDKNRVSVISNGVNTQAFKPMKKIECREALGIPKKIKVILSVGSLIEGKGHHKIIECLPNLLKIYSDLRLYIVGSTGPAGNFKKSLINRINLLNLGEKIFLVGDRPNNELVLWYNAADVFCLATSTEGSPNVVLEALSCGCPVIASAVGGIPDILCEGFLGKIFNINSSDELERTIYEFFQNEWKNLKIRKHIEKFSWDWCAKKVVKRYKNELLKYYNS